MIDEDLPSTDVPAASAEPHVSREPPTREYSTERITVEWHAERCRHSGNCVRAQPTVFNPRRHPWIEVGATDAEAIARAVQRCPSGALHYVWHDRQAADPRDEPTGGSGAAAPRNEAG